MENKYLIECERQSLETLALQVIKMVIDEDPTRDELRGIYDFLIYLSKDKNNTKV